MLMSVQKSYRITLKKKTIIQVYSIDFLPNNNNWLISKINWFN